MQKCTHSRRELVGNNDTNDGSKGRVDIVLDPPDGRCNFMINRPEGDFPHLLTGTILHAKKEELTMVRQSLHF